jgi:hypothetical protein
MIRVKLFAGKLKKAFGKAEKLDLFFLADQEGKANAISMGKTGGVETLQFAAQGM